MGIAASTVAIISAVSSAVGGVVSVYGQMQSAHAAEAAANYNAQVASNNQIIAQRNATMAAQAGEQQAAVAEQKTRAEAGAIKAGQAAGNIDVNSGSAVDVQSSAAELGELNAITLRSNAAKTAYGYQTQGSGYGDQATLDRSQASYQSTAGAIGAASTFLGGMGSAATNYEKYQLQAAGSMTAPGGNAP